MNHQEEEDLLPLDFFLWTDEQLAKLPLLELLVLSFDGEASLHPGGVISTDRLFQKLSLGPNDYVLEIGCGSAKDLCRLVDIVIAQSVLATILDKDKAATEVSRVLKSGGHFGDIELIWIDEPDDELVYNVEKRIGSFDRPLKSSEWIGLFKEAGLKETSIFTSNDFGFPTDIFSVIKHNGSFVESMKLLMLIMSRGNRINLTKRTEHLRWMKDSGKIGYGIYVFEKI